MKLWARPWWKEKCSKARLMAKWSCHFLSNAAKSSTLIARLCTGKMDCYFKLIGYIFMSEHSKKMIACLRARFWLVCCKIVIGQKSEIIVDNYIRSCYDSKGRKKKVNFSVPRDSARTINPEIWCCAILPKTSQSPNIRGTNLKRFQTMEIKIKDH